MKITFLGTSHGVPERERRCASTLIEIGENRYFIDMGTQSIEGLVDRGIAVESVKAVFITHMHGDHTHGLISFIDLCGWYFKKAQPKIFLPCDMQNIKCCINSWFLLNGSTLRDNIEFFEVSEGALYDDGVVKITAFKTMHCENSFAYLLECENKRVLFSGDLSRHPEKDFPMSVLDKPLELCVCECAHFEATEYVPIFKATKNLKQLYLNHIYPPREPSILELKQALNIPVVVASDNSEIVI